jgi:hypothetical protein
MPQALSWLATAQDCFDDAYGSLRSGLLTSVFSLVIGLERVFHVDEMEDAGFARLTGGRRCPSRYTVGGWRRHLAWYEVDAFCRRTCPWHLIRKGDVLVSFDEHAIPRWTKKFRISKGYVTTRNKHMRCEKLFTAFDVESGRFLTTQATPGKTGLHEVSVPLVQQVLQQGRPHSLHAVFDAGAGKSDADIRLLWDLAAWEPRLEVTLRACRYPHRMRAWKQLPSGLFVSDEEPGVCVGAPPKEIRLAETTTVLKDESPEQQVDRQRDAGAVEALDGAQAPGQLLAALIGLLRSAHNGLARRQCVGQQHAGERGGLFVVDREGEGFLVVLNAAGGVRGQRAAHHDV